MPHDSNAKEVRPGDRVLVECVIESVQANDEYCNVNLRTVEPMFPTKQSSTFVLNARQVSITQPRHDADYAKRLEAIGNRERVMETTLREIRSRLNGGDHPGSVMMQIHKLIDKALEPAK